MDTDWELWGTFSVRDHLRPRAFVADVLLYDRLVVPTPPAGDEEEVHRWVDKAWRPERQRRLLSLIGRERVIAVPWDRQQQSNWQARHSAALGEEQPGPARGSARLHMAADAAFDVSVTRAARERFAAEGRPGDLDELAYHTTRLLLVDWSNRHSDATLFCGLPLARVDAVSAYGSFASFCRDHQLVEAAGSERVEPSGLLDVFGWEFLVPADSQLSDDDLLKQALELAALPETQRHRRLFHIWRRGEVLAGRTPQEARQEMEDAIAGYHAAIVRSRILTQAKWAFAFITALTGAGAVAFPPLGIAGAFAGLGAFAVSEAEKQVFSEHLKFAAMFHDARRRFA